MNEIIITAFGWGFLFYLNTRTLKKSEISRMKDRVIDRIEKTQEWYSKEYLKTNSSSERTEIEDYFSGKISNIELRLTQINNYIGKDIFSPNCLVEWRSIDNTASDKNQKQTTLKEIHDASLNIIDYIERNYDIHNNRKLSIPFNNTLLAGACLGLASCYLFIRISQLLFNA